VIRFDSLRYRIGDFSICVSQEVADGEYFVLLGSTGSGKTLFLECLCGLRRIHQGTVEINGLDVTRTDPGARGFGYVPQDGALFNHLDVRGNIAFSLKVRGLSRSEREVKVLEITRMLGIEHLLSRRIQGLSGGERQRVALARALACEPVLLVLDEPVSALDAYTRDAVCRELVMLKRSTGVTVIHVCHTFEEAHLVADRIGVLRNGRIVQVGTADELMMRPADRYVANLFRLENIFAGNAVPTAEGSNIDVNGFQLLGPAAEGEVEVLIRPWEIRLVSEDTESGENRIDGRIAEVSLAGPMAKVKVDGPFPLHVLLPRAHVTSGELVAGKRVKFAFDRGAIHVFGHDPQLYEGP